MTAHRTLVNVAFAVAALLLLPVLLLWPAGAGGSSTFAVTRGASMEPVLSRGDLVILRTARTYRVGDIAAYRSPSLRRLVVHRIATIEGDVFTFRGDANAFQDPERVRAGDVAGRLSFSVPVAGHLLRWLVNPVNALLLAILVVLAVREVRRGRDLMTLRARPAVVDLLDSPRIIPISSMSLPHELPIADIVDPTVMLRLADQYDRPVLHDQERQALFVIEATVLFRSKLVRPEVVPVLRVVRERPGRKAVVATAAPVAPYQQRSRRATPSGRDWRYPPLAS